MNDIFKKILAWIVGAAGLAILAMAIQYWISLNVADQLANAGIVPKGDFSALDARVSVLENVHEKDVDRVERKAEAIAQILMEHN